MSYTERLVYLNAETLELGYLKLDLTMMSCIIRGFVNIDCDKTSIIDCETSHTRGHNKIFKEHCNINRRLNSFVCIILMYGIVCQPML